MRSNPKRQLGILRSVFIYYWKPLNRRRLKRFYSQFIHNGDLCFDIGAHLGNRSDSWLQLGAKVVAVEPQPACIDFLHKKFDGENRFTLVEKAVGRESGTATLHISNLTPTVTTLADAGWREMINEDTAYQVNWDETIAVEVITLDSLVEKYGLPAFCKIDVENFEFEVLSGLTFPVPALSVEFFRETPDMTLACIRRLKALGHYEFNWSFGETQKMYLTDWVNAEEVSIMLTGISPDQPASGDLYARLVDPIKNIS